MVLAEDRLNETSPAHRGGPPKPPRRPYWPAALFVIGLLVAVLGAAVVLNDRFRPRPTIETPATTVLSTTPPAAAVTPSTPPTVQPTALPPPTAAPTAVPTAAAVPTGVSSPTAAAPGATSASAAPEITPAGAAAANALTPLQKEIVDAYLRYWDVLARAQYDLDTSRLTEVLAGAELARSEEDIRRLRAQGHAAHIDVELNYRITKARPDEATVYDEYVNRSVVLDAVTKQRISTKEPSPDIVKLSFEMRKIDGTWKVVDTARHG